MSVLSFYEIFHDYECEQLEKMQDEHQKMKRLYPSFLNEIQSAVNEICDRLEYEGSPMFHNSIDSVWLEAQVATIHQKLSPANKSHNNLSPTSGPYLLPNRPCSHPLSCPAPLPDKDSRNQWDNKKALITILLLDEISFRRCRYFRRKRYCTYYAE